MVLYRKKGVLVVVWDNNCLNGIRSCGSAEVGRWREKKWGSLSTTIKILDLSFGIGSSLGGFKV